MCNSALIACGLLVFGGGRVFSVQMLTEGGGATLGSCGEVIVHARLRLSSGPAAFESPTLLLGSPHPCPSEPKNLFPQLELCLVHAILECSWYTWDGALLVSNAVQSI